MNRIKKAGTIFLVAAMLCAGTAVPAFAKEATPAPQTSYVVLGENQENFDPKAEGLSGESTQAPVNYVIYGGDAEEIMPFSDYLSSLSCDIDEADGGLALYAIYSSRATYKVEVSLTLQYSTDGGSTWKNKQTWTKTYDPGNGTKLFSRTYTSPTKGYMYRNKAYAAVKNASGSTLESFTLFSREITY